jgi:nicotinate dehydrogenase subunit A
MRCVYGAVDGQPTRSCVTLVSSIGESKVVILAGLGTPDKPHPLQTTYIEEQVPQMRLLPQWLALTAAAFLRDNPQPAELHAEAIVGMGVPFS